MAWISDVVSATKVRLWFLFGELWRQLISIIWKLNGKFSLGRVPMMLHYTYVLVLFCLEAKNKDTAIALLLAVLSCFFYGFAHVSQNTSGSTSSI